MSEGEQGGQHGSQDEHKEDLDSTERVEQPSDALEQVETAAQAGDNVDGAEPAGTSVDADAGEPSEQPSSLLPPMDIPVRTPTTEEIDHVAALHTPESPTTALLAAFRSQIASLSDQSTALNAKLIQALTARSDLEDAHATLHGEHATLQARAKDLQAEKERWEESMNTGLLVERSVIAIEMQKLAAGLVEEERRRGSAEERRQQVENEVDDLAASLFDQANTMVATERLARTEAEDRLKRTEENLAAAETAMRAMQTHLQSMSDRSITSPKAEAEAKATRYLSSHLPYTEFLSFVDSLHSLRPLKNARRSAFPPPLISTYLAHPFINRIVVEDHEPTIRLDAAPHLSYFSRRNVGPAIIAGELIVEPVSASTVINNTTTPAHEIGCALCGKPVFPTTVPQSPATSHFGTQVAHPTAQRQSLFSLKPFFNKDGGSPSAGASPSASPLASPSPAGYPAGATSLPSVYVFRVAATAGSEKEAKAYPLCRSGWCLERLRAACELWHFIRTGIIHVVWNADDGWLHPLERQKSKPTPLSTTTAPINEEDASQASTTPTAPSTAVDSTSVAGVANVVASDKAEKKKSGGWGLGFKFGRSGSSTPPISPGVGDASQDANLSEKLGLDPPVEIRQTESPVDEKTEAVQEVKTEEEGHEVDSEAKVEDVPRIEEVAASPRSDQEPESEGGLARSESSVSAASSAGGDFSTPKGQGAELPETEGGDHESKEESQAEDKKEADGEEEAIPPTETVDLNSPNTPAPPPIPRRAAGRGAVPPRTPVEGEAVTHEVHEGEEHPQDSNEGDITVVAPPPLPPRHPRTPVLSSARERLARAGVDGEKRWLDTEGGWEEKAWRQVVLLKLGMFKARVGMSDEAQE